MLAGGNAWLPGRHIVRGACLPRWRASNAVPGSDGGPINDDREFQGCQGGAGEEEKNKLLQARLSLAADFARKDAAVISR